MTFKNRVLDIELQRKSAKFNHFLIKMLLMWTLKTTVHNFKHVKAMSSTCDPN